HAGESSGMSEIEGKAAIDSGEIGGSRNHPNKTRSRNDSASFASPREERIKVRSEKTWMLKLLSSTFSILLVMRTFATAGEIPAHDADYDYDPPVPGSYNLPVVKVAPDGALLGSEGKSLNLRDL